MRKPKSLSEQPLIFTSNYASVRGLPPEIEPVGISAGVPRWFGKGRRFERRLAPTRQMLVALQHGRMTVAQYERKYIQLLGDLEPQEIFDSLTKKGLQHVAILCWCARGKVCHRRYAAEWFEAHLGIAVPEFGIERSLTETYFDWE